MAFSTDPLTNGFLTKPTSDRATLAGGGQTPQDISQAPSGNFSVPGGNINIGSQIEFLKHKLDQTAPKVDSSAWTPEQLYNVSNNLGTNQSISSFTPSVNALSQSPEPWSLDQIKPVDTNNQFTTQNQKRDSPVTTGEGENSATPYNPGEGDGYTGLKPTEFKMSKVDIVTAMKQKNPRLLESFQNGDITDDDIFYASIKKYPKIRDAVQNNQVDIQSNANEDKLAAENRFRQLNDGATVPYMQTEDDATSIPGVIGQFIGNTGKSAYNLAAGIGNMISNPVESAKNLGEIALGAAYNVGSEITQFATGKTDAELKEKLRTVAPQWRSKLIEESDTKADGVGDYLKSRYGSAKGFSEASYNDPVGVFSDMMSVISGGSSLAAKGSSLLGDLSTANKLTKFSKAANAADPATMIMNQGSKGIKYAGDVVKEKIIQPYVNPIIDIGKEKASSRLDVTDLKPEEKRAIQDNPYIKEEFETLKQRDGEVTSKEVQQERIQSTVDEIVSSVDGRIADLEKTGPIYNEIKKSPKPNATAPLKDNVGGIIAGSDIKVNSDGKLDFSESNIGNKSTMNQIQDAYDRVMSLPEKATAKEIINARQAIKDIKNEFNQNHAIVQRLYGAVGEHGKKTITGLKEADSLYSKQITELKELKKGLTDKEGKVLQGTYNKVKNANNLTNTAFADKLDKYFPGATDRIEAINQAQKLFDKYNKDAKLGLRKTIAKEALKGSIAYAVGQAFGLQYGFGAYILESMVERMIGNKLNGLKKIQIDKIVGSLSPEGIENLQIIGDKIRKAEQLTQNEKVQLDDLKNVINNAVEGEKKDIDTEKFIQSLYSDAKALPNKEIQGSNPNTIIAPGEPIVSGPQGNYRASQASLAGEKQAGDISSRVDQQLQGQDILSRAVRRVKAKKQ